MESSNAYLRFATQPWMRAELLKAVYAALLAELPPTAVLEFWARHPFSLLRDALPTQDFLRYLWEGRSPIPAAYFWSVLADLEIFLAGKGIRAERVFQLLNHGPDGGPPLDPDWVIRALPSPLSASLPTDPHAWLLAGFPELIRNLLPGCRIDGIGSAPFVTGSRLFLFQPLSLAPESAAPDFRLFPGKLLQDMPKLFGCAAFNRLDVLADMRGSSASLGVAPEDDWNWKGDSLHFGQRRMGRMESLERAIAAWPETAELRRALKDLLGSPVLRMEKDFGPAGAKEPRLRKDRIYASPIAIVRIGYSGNRSWDRLAAWLRRKPAGPPEAPPTWEVADRLHRELLDGSV